MKRKRNPFTPEQQAILAANPFTASVTEYQIRFTLAFKQFVLKERERFGTPRKEIFLKAGYDPEMLGKDRLNRIVDNIYREASSEQGLRETPAKKLTEKDLEHENMRKAIRQLQEEVVRLNQTVEFLKKTQQLRFLEEHDI